jgi:hypothetical protein
MTKRINRLLKQNCKHSKKFGAMGTFERGVFAGFKGKVGSVIGTKWNGQQFMRSEEGPRSKGFASKKPHRS